MRNDHSAKPVGGTLRWPAQSIKYVEHKGKKAGYVFPDESHEEHEITYVDYGRMRLVLGEKSRVCEPGACVIIPSGAHHSIQSYEDKPFSFLNVMYSGRCPKQLSNKVLHLSADERDLFFDLKREAESSWVHHESVLLLRLNLLLFYLDRNQQHPAARHPITGANRLSHSQLIVHRALDFLEAHYMKPLDPELVSKHAGVSASHLRRLLLRETGKNLSQHLRHIRIESAKKILMESPANANEAAYRVGYESASHFCTVFKKETGMTTTEYAQSLGTPMYP